MAFKLSIFSITTMGKKESPRSIRKRDMLEEFGLYPGRLEWILVIPFSQICELKSLDESFPIKEKNNLLQYKKNR
ncbi:hypothetical protein BpHYR1_024854 [Brachionus plicatilis]|uniref:Uncharacterized protein n=1 Tax=Brachionus plicatilis TaxID=10195 RepID=A0A3M7QIY4_BRAPC|nr:hypothetical protein BpHYR1_024854 [Brachionus plicatilis]